MTNDCRLPGRFQWAASQSTKTLCEMDLASSINSEVVPGLMLQPNYTHQLATTQWSTRDATRDNPLCINYSRLMYQYHLRPHGRDAEGNTTGAVT